MISDEELKGIASVDGLEIAKNYCLFFGLPLNTIEEVMGPLGKSQEMATELLQLREEKRKAITPETEQTTDNKTYYCSFCGKTNKDVSTMILGPAVAICNECVRLCLGVLLDKNEGKTIPGEVPK